MTIKTDQIKIDFDKGKWPNQNDFPLNLAAESRRVSALLYSDIKESTHFTIITGFTSLSNLIDLFGSNQFSNLKHVRVLIGFEPNLKGRKEYKFEGLDKEIKDYWLKNGLSIMQGGAVINLIEKINTGFISFRFRDKLHAKIYVGDYHAILGSSNFSYNGLNIQEEANIRVRNDFGITNDNQYRDVKLIADSYYEDSNDYNLKMISLLHALIKEVSWQEALARAIAEILEGSWLNDYKDILSRLEQTKLWPTQLKGLAQGVSILQNQSNVLIADPTGAGKTKLCTALVLSLKHWLYEVGKNLRTESLIICPPLVVDKWEDEFKSFKRLGHSQRSMGLLSTTGKNQQKLIKELSIANILTIDEAHNYLSPDSNRTSLIKENTADYKILITATPISKKVEDLLRLIDLLDVDNLSDEDFATFQELNYNPLKKHKPEHIDMLRRFISKFTVRRTKKALNQQIEKDPSSYHNRMNVTCKFPKQHELTYRTQETKDDIAIVKEINLLAQQLKGVTYFLHFRLPKFEITKDESLQGYIANRLTAGRALSIYMIRSALRSSHVALVEHIEGTKAAMKHFEFEGKNKHSGNKIEKINDLIHAGKLPPRSKKFIDSYFPNWLTDLELYHKACEEEVNIYKKISSLAKRLSGKRELGKVKELIKASKMHDNILAFDGTVISLYYFRKLFNDNFPNQNLIIASGSENDRDSNKVLEIFKLDSTIKENYIALCSDKMSESVDLQKASCVFLLDIPSVLRIVEQRIGRVDRMDSMHTDIDIFWPDDSEEYSLKADSRLIETNEIVEKIYGSNFEVPDTLKGKLFTKIDSTKDIINEYKEFVDKDESWGGIQDSFQCITDLKEGKDALISEGIYSQFINVTSEVRTRVSFLSSPNDWCFIALRGGKSQSPRWYFIDSKNIIHTDYPDICEQLRKNISTKSVKMEWNDLVLERYVNLFKLKEIELLSPKKYRALKVAEHILSKKMNSRDTLAASKDIYRRMIKILQVKSDLIIDYERLAEDWILILQPFLKIKRENNKRRKIVLNLYNLKNDYNNISLCDEDLIRIIDNCVIADKIDMRIAACIIGVGDLNEREVDLS